MFARATITLSLLLAAPAFAGDKITMQALDVNTSVPAPPWTEQHRIAADTESMRERKLSQAGTYQFMRAYVPKGQTFDNWLQRYEVTAESPVALSTEEHRNTYAKTFQSQCQNAALAPVQQGADRQVFILFCPFFLETPETGAFVVGVIERQGETLVQVNYRQRVPAFDIADRSTFPKTQDELKALVQYLNAAVLLPS